MNASKLYISTCRLVLKADSEDQSSWSDLDTLLPSLRLALSCTVCGNLLNEPYTPTDTSCQHHVCRTCVGSKKTIKPNCSWCKNYEMYTENKQLDIILQCYRKLCEYIKISPIYNRLLEVVDRGGPNDLIDLIEEFDQGKPKLSSESSLLNDTHRTLISADVENGEIPCVASHSLSSSPSKTEPKEEVICNSNYESDTSDIGFVQTQINSSFCDDFQSLPNNTGEPSSISSEGEFLMETAPVLSPVQEQVENVSSNDVAPTLSPVQLEIENLDQSETNALQLEIEESEQCETNAIQLQIEKADQCETNALQLHIEYPNQSQINTVQFEIRKTLQTQTNNLPLNVSESMKTSGLRELSTSSNYETETNSDTSSMSSISSPLQISPALPSHEESPEDVIQEELDEFNLATSLTTASVLELQPSPDLIEAADCNVLDSLDDDASYGDLADINLSSCPLTSIGEESIKDEIISSISDSVLSFQSTTIPTSQITFSSNDKDANVFAENPSKYELSNSINTLSQLSSSNLCPKYHYTLCPSKVIASTQTSLDNSISNHQTTNVAMTHFYPTNSLGNLTKTSSSTTHINTIPVPVVCTPTLMNNSISLQSNYSTSIQTSPFIRTTSNVNTARMISPTMLSNIRTAVISPTNMHQPVASANNTLCHSLTPQLVHAPISSPQIIQSSVISNQVIQQSITSHHVVHKSMASNNQLVIPKSLPSHLIDPSVPSCHLGNSTNLLVNPLTSPSDIPRLFISNPPSSVSSHNTQFHTPISHQKFSASNHTPPNNLSYSSVSSPHANPSLSSNFMNILPAGTIFSANVDKKANNETQLKNTPLMNNGSSMYSVMFSEGDSTKITIKRTPPDTKTFTMTNPNLPKPQQIPVRQEGITNMNIPTIHMNQNLMKKPIKPKAKPKPKPKRKGCRCGNATPSPGKLTCCGQRCPCYVEAKACIECRCKGCRNPHRPGGKKVRPVIPHQANIQIHQIQPVHGRVIAGVPKVNNPSMIPLPISVQHQYQQQQLPQHNSPQTTTNLSNPHVATSSPQTIRTFQAIHAVKAVQGISSIQSIVSGNQLLNVKECVLDNAMQSSIAQESMVPVSNIISMKPIKVRLDPVPNQLSNQEIFSNSADSDSSDVDIDA